MNHDSDFEGLDIYEVAGSVLALCILAASIISFWVALP